MASHLGTPAAAAQLDPPVLAVSALLPSPAAPPPKRHDTLQLKLRLAQLLPEDHGAVYWAGLADFMTGHITRQEWDDVLERAFTRDPLIRDQAIKLHNALLLSILYNTTRPFLPPSSVRHSGFHPRGAKKRIFEHAGGEDDGGLVEEKRRRLVKDRVMALGRRERGDLKLLGSASAAVAHKGKLAKESAADEERRRRRLNPLSEAVGGASRGGGGRVDLDNVPAALRDREREGKALPPSLPHDYTRLVQAPLCCESRLLPDADTLRDRMLALAYEEGMVEGVEGRVAGLVQGAIEHHLKNMVASVISLVRGTRQASPPPLPRTASNSVASTPNPASTSTFAPAGASPAPPPTSDAQAADAPAKETSALPLGDERIPLTIADFHALFAFSPGLLGQHPTLAAVERMYAIAPPDSESDSDDDDASSSGAADEAEAARTGARTNAQKSAIEAKKDADGDSAMLSTAPAPPNAVPTTGAGAGKHPRLSRSRASSFYGATRPVPVSTPAASSSLVTSPTTTTSGSLALAAARQKLGRFVLDPSSTHGVPSGHPDVPPLPSTPQPLLPPHLGGPSVHAPSASGSAGAGADAQAGAVGGAGALSPKSLALRNSLFPELASGGAPSAPSGSATPGGAGDGGAAGDGNGTSTDAGESDSDDEHKASRRASAQGPGLKIKLGGGGGPAQGAQQQQQLGQAGARPMPTNEKDREAGRKLWEVVDSVGLLDGVLQ
ncbi:Hfi1p [Rhodotorula paludigena]|uniref:Hfi1p n=1 Tax=Rhodotorula paludigena TaxID=86838 RepID=UPI00316E6A18